MFDSDWQPSAGAKYGLDQPLSINTKLLKTTLTFAAVSFKVTENTESCGVTDTVLTRCTKKYGGSQQEAVPVLGDTACT